MKFILNFIFVIFLFITWGIKFIYINVGIYKSISINLMIENGNNNITILSKLIDLQKLVKKESSLNELCKVINHNIIL